MGEHKNNQIAKANGVPKQQVQVIDIGKGCGLIGFEIRTMIGTDGSAHAVLVAIGGKLSSLVPMEPIGVGVCELGSIKLSELHRHFGVVDLEDDAKPESQSS